MGSNPLNLAFRFVLEIAALVALGRWGFAQGTGFLRYGLAVGLPLVAASLWGTFAVPGDPSRSGGAPVPVPGLVRLGVEGAVFGAATLALWRADTRAPAIAFGAGVLAHYALSYDRIAWLARR